MSGMMDGVSKFWIMRADRGLDIHGCAGPYDAAWYAGVWSEGFSEGAEQRLRDAIGEIERAVAGLKDRVVEDYECESYDALPPAGTPVDQKLYNEACREVLRLKERNALLENDKDQLLTLSQSLSEHPDDYDGPCSCKLCMSYG